MSKSSFIFIATAFLTLPLAEIESSFYTQVEVIFCLVLIASFGIAHGAIDNHLYGFKNFLGNLRFIGVYILVGAAFAGLWFIQASLAFSIFMIISAYHFGQSQLVEEIEDQSLFPRLVYSAWGSWLLSAFLFLNQEELFAMSLNDFERLPVFLWMLENSFQLFLLSSGVLGILLFLSVFMGFLLKSSLLLELYQIAIIFIVFYFSSTLWGFTLYFVILHSGRVLQQEYSYLADGKRVRGVWGFIKLLSPFTIISLVGLTIIVIFFAYFDLQYSYSLLALVFISCLTVPHSWVMDRFYQKSLQTK